MTSSRAAVAICLAAAAAPAQPRKFDLQRNFFASDALEAQDRRDVVAQFGRLDADGETATRSQASLRATLLLWSDLEKRFRLHDLYFFARSAVNTEDRHEPEVQEVRQARRSATRAVHQAICAAPEAHLHRLTRPPRTLPSSCGRPRRNVRTVPPPRRKRSSTAMISSPILPSISMRSRGRSSGPSARAAASPRRPQDQGVLLADDSASVRAETEKKLWDGFASHAELFAHGLAQMVHLGSQGAFPASTQAAWSRRWPARSLRRRWCAAGTTRSRPRGNGRERSPRRTGSPRRDCDSVSTTRRPSSVARSRRSVPTISARRSPLFDPRNGRVDVEGGPHRLPMQGTSSVDPIGTSIFYAFQFAGNYLDLMLLAHESGHATQAMMMSRNGVARLNGRGPAWVTESFGRFNEFLVAGDLFAATSAFPPARAHCGRSSSDAPSFSMERRPRVPSRLPFMTPSSAANGPRPNSSRL